MLRRHATSVGRSARPVRLPICVRAGITIGSAHRPKCCNDQKTLTREASGSAAVLCVSLFSPPLGFFSCQCSASLQSVNAHEQGRAARALGCGRGRERERDRGSEWGKKRRKIGYRPAPRVSRLIAPARTAVQPSRAESQGHELSKVRWWWVGTH